jgi:hypothetical protein
MARLATGMGKTGSVKEDWVVGRAVMGEGNQVTVPVGGGVEACGWTECGHFSKGEWK